MPITGDYSSSVATAERSAAISAASCLQLLLRFKDHDLPIFSDSKLRWTTNGPSMYSYIRLNRWALCEALEKGIENPGAGADIAMQDFNAAVTSWLTPREHSVTSILMEGLSFDRKSAAASDVDKLVILAVLRWDDLEGMIGEIATTGRYNRALCKGIKDIRTLPGYEKFDPSTDEGSGRWKQLRRLFMAFFRMPVSAIRERELMRLNYRQHRQGLTEMRKFISADDLLFEEFEASGGEVSDRTRVEWMQEKISTAATLAMGEHKKLMKSLGRKDAEMDSDWFKYTDALIMVCSDLSVQAPAAPAAPAVKPAAPTQVPAGGLPPRASGGRQLTKMQLQAIHRFAAASGKAFSNVALEEVEAAEGGVEKWSSIPQKAAEDMFKAQQDQAFGNFDSDKSEPRVYPVLKKRSVNAKTQARDPTMFCMLKQSG